jgi:hypothetical protein
MREIHEGQCGLCIHFGEHHPDHAELHEIRRSHQAREDFVDECGHPEHHKLHLKVTPTSGCDGFEAAAAR